jgi:hypothetical protein
MLYVCVVWFITQILISSSIFNNNSIFRYSYKFQHNSFALLSLLVFNSIDHTINKFVYALY